MPRCLMLYVIVQDMFRQVIVSFHYQIVFFVNEAKLMLLYLPKDARPCGAVTNQCQLFIIGALTFAAST